MNQKKLTLEEQKAVEMGREHISFERENDFRPGVMVLIGEVSKLFRIYVRNGEKEELRETRRMILHYLEHHDGCSQQDIVTYSHFSAPAVSNEIEKMEKDGLLRREKNEKDARAVCLFLTDDGKRKNKETHDYFTERSRNITDALTPAEQEIFYGMLSLLREKILNELE